MPSCMVLLHIAGFFFGAVALPPPWSAISGEPERSIVPASTGLQLSSRNPRADADRCDWVVHARSRIHTRSKNPERLSMEFPRSGDIAVGYGICAKRRAGATRAVC